MIGSTRPGRGHPAPQRSRLRLGGISIPQEQVQLMRIQAHRSARTGHRPAGKAALGQALVAKPEPLAIVSQTADGMAPPRTEEKERAGKRIAAQGLTAERGQSIDPLAIIPSSE